MDDYGKRFGDAVAAELRAQRARKRITFDALAAQTGLAKTTVLNYLNGHRDIPMPAFFDLCRALDVSPRAIFLAAQDAIEDQ
ncbi:immunity repressor [Propionibacterium phage Anatole]|uniref:Immunity repressor n=3 Tax=Caudoviricetes TaxID=2731619 RepID=A0A1D8ET97_9CAUD|nr:immunity repressor [Propionibacterium phage Anatole]YP_009597012.1 immunity repressor [Propionibacterium phage E6]AOT24268.1 immunity repressor [Propionibacterium phage Anatole]AOT24504.1 immunity repressor [Propionibacterium phage E1]AOT24559.1 immunity repressor [Propionibacterium phage E6]